MVRPTKPSTSSAVDHHQEVLEQRAETGAVGGVLGQERPERVVVDDHQVEEEHLHARDDRDHIRNQLTVPLAVDVHRHRPEARQQRTQNMIEPSRPPQWPSACRRAAERNRRLVDVLD